MSFAVACLGGDANGAWFEGHQLKGAPPEVVEIAVGSDVGPALLDLPEDELELGERIVRYRLSSTGIACTRGRGGGCNHVATYVPEGLEQAPHLSRGFGRQVREAAGLSPPLRAADAQPRSSEPVSRGRTRSG